MAARQPSTALARARGVADGRAEERDEVAQLAVAVRAAKSEDARREGQRVRRRAVVDLLEVALAERHARRGFVAVGFVAVGFVVVGLVVVVGDGALALELEQQRVVRGKR